MKYGTNWYIVFLAVMFSLMVNHYFGWNFKPQSDAELICDGIVFLLMALAFSVPSRESPAPLGGGSHGSSGGESP